MMEHIIQNFDGLAEHDLRRDALEIAEAGYEAINVGNALRRKLHIRDDELHIDDGYRKSINLRDRKIFFVGIGKCAFTAASAIEEIFHDTITDGIALDVSSFEPQLKKIKTLVGTHPLPSEENMRATEQILQFLSERTEEDVVIMLVSGGGSTLLCSPEAPMTPADESMLFKELTVRGATIQEMNTVRKHTSRARGGGLVRAAYPAEVVALIVSDVPGNDLAFISSGPSVPDTSTIVDAEDILAHYSITPSPNVTFLETEKGEKYFERVSNILFLSNQDALAAMRDAAARHDYTAEIVDEKFSGEARALGRTVVEKLHAAPKKTALLYAGESTVTFADTECLQTSGLGGRNQEMALAALEDLRPDELILPFASDGHDNTDHAGAIGDATTMAHAREKNLSATEYLAAHRSYNFFSTTGDALLTGYTGSNVSDLIIALKK